MADKKCVYDNYFGSMCMAIDIFSEGARKRIQDYMAAGFEYSQGKEEMDRKTPLTVEQVHDLSEKCQECYNARVKEAEANLGFDMNRVYEPPKPEQK